MRGRQNRKRNSERGGSRNQVSKTWLQNGAMERRANSDGWMKGSVGGWMVERMGRERGPETMRHSPSHSLTSMSLSLDRRPSVISSFGVSRSERFDTFGVYADVSAARAPSPAPLDDNSSTSPLEASLSIGL